MSEANEQGVAGIDPNAPPRAPVPRATAAELSEPGCYFVDFGPGLPLAILEVFRVNVSLHPGTSPRATAVTPTLMIRVPGEQGVWSPADYIGNFRPRRVKRINPGVDTFSPDRPAFALMVRRAGVAMLIGRIDVTHGDPHTLAAVEMQANGNRGDLRVWINETETPGGRVPAEAFATLPETPAARYWPGEPPPLCPLCGGSHFPAECPSPTPNTLAPPVEPAGVVAVPVPSTVRGVPPGDRLQAFAAAHGPENAADVRRTGDPADAQGDEFDH